MGLGTGCIRAKEVMGCLGPAQGGPPGLKEAQVSPETEKESLLHTPKSFQYGLRRPWECYSWSHAAAQAGSQGGSSSQPPPSPHQLWVLHKPLATLSLSFLLYKMEMIIIPTS